MTYTVTIPGWHPTRLNQLLRNWGKEHRLKSKDRGIVGSYCLLSARIPPAMGKRRVTLTIVLGKGQRGGDVDSYHKSLLDSLKACHMITDDNQQGAELAPVQFKRAPLPGTVIELEDL